MEKQMTANEILKAIEGMDNSERIKLLNELSAKHFGKRPSLEEIRWRDYNAFHGDEEY
ncbi:hypothetical protein [Metabacillus fastidiosus]|uniref:hypothetical protein n=1 Tax=Metabacillus fastidiosus TaxID=1458 RepID=UPI002DBD4B00|nr:hypothetical protein [Metabacillus fastidiosus]MEC2075426.1 hypothetical protein [Metabacillus fastidiosus]